MKSRNIAWVFAGLTAVSMGMAAEACSSSSSNGGGESSSTTTTSTSSSAATSTSSSSTVTTSSSSSCHKAPPALHAEDGGSGLYCPFSAVGDGGKNLSCAVGEHCCEPTTDGVPSTCIPLATSCTGGATDWQCEGTPDCAASPGTVCCGTGVINTQAPCGDIPMYSYVSGFKGSTCATSCTSAEFQICSKDSECPGGAAGSCQAIEPKGNGIGFCAGGGGGGGASSTTSSSSTASSTASSSETSSSSAGSSTSGSSSGSASGSGS